MESEVKDLDNLKQEECIKVNGTHEETNISCKNEQEPSEETTDKSGIAVPKNHIDSSDCKEISNGVHTEINHEMIKHSDGSQILEVKEELETGEQSDNDRGDDQDADEEKEEVEEKDEECDKVDKEKSPSAQDNQDDSHFDRLSLLGRNRRVRQKNRYFLDFHCIDLTKGARSNRDDYDSFSTSTATRSSNRRSTTDSARGQQDEQDVFEARYCRKCSNKTPHDIDGGCQCCLYKKIVESSKRQKPTSQKNRSVNPKQQQQQHDNATTESSTPTTSNRNKRKAPKQGGSKCSSISSSGSNINANNAINPEPNIEISKPTIDDSNKLPRLDSWTPDEVAEYILSKGFSNEAELFKTQSVDGISLLLMQRTDFTYGLKIKLGPALKIYDQVCKLKKEYFRSITNTTQCELSSK